MATVAAAAAAVAANSHTFWFLKCNFKKEYGLPLVVMITAASAPIGVDGKEVEGEAALVVAP